MCNKVIISPHHLEYRIELQTKVPEDNTKFSQVPSWLKAPPGTFTFKTLLRHYANQAFTYISRCEIGMLISKRLA